MASVETPTVNSQAASKKQTPSSPLPLPLSLNQKKQKMQVIWKCIFVLITIGSTIFFQKIYKYHTIQYFASIRKGSLFALLAIGIPSSIIYIWLDTFCHNVFDPLCQKYYINHVKYPQEEARKKRCYTIVKWFFSIFYYTTMSVFAYFILLPTSYMPVWLGGSGDCTDCIRYINSFDEATFTMELFYGIQFGKHFGRFFMHVFIRPEGNFYQYTLHHAISTFLIFFSYMMNFWMIGIFLLMIHDISDVSLILPRAYRDYRAINKPLLQFLYIFMAATWIPCRIVILSYCAVLTSLKNLYVATYYPEQFDPILMQVLYLPGMLMAVMLCALQVLQVFWTYHILTSFIQVNVSSKIAKHTYD